MTIGVKTLKVIAGLLAATALGLALPSHAEPSPPAETGATPPPAIEQPTTTTGVVTETPLSALMRQTLASISPATDEDQAEQTILSTFYEQRKGEPLWMSEYGLSPKAQNLVTEIKNAAAYGLDPAAFALPGSEAISSPAARAEAELALSRAALKYARHARGGRIMKPSEQLNSNLDRKPQLLDPKTVLDGLASADDPAAYLRSLHPKHPQFEKLRQAWLSATKGGSEKPNAAAKRLRTNMEQWRWMWEDMGDLYVLNNIPEFKHYVYKNGAIVHSDIIVVGMLDKQTAVFSRQLQTIALRPKWRMPESIMVHELWPSLLRGGGLMRQYGLEIETKDGRPVDWKKIDWSKDDIRNYYVLQPPGRKSVLGVVKFSFPSQHTIYMHDTPDKWMFRSRQRTHSHGCMRVKKPVELAQVLLAEDKGWDAAKVKELLKSGPLHNEVELTRKLPIHTVYFTAWVSDDGKIATFPDVYGHEKRITQALDGEWNKIAKGRDHLAPPQPRFDPSKPITRTASGKSKPPQSAGDFVTNALGLSF